MIYSSLFILLSVLTFRTRLINGAYNTKICVSSGSSNWLSSLDGEWEYTAFVHGAPSYTQKSCSSKPDSCNIKRTLAVRGIGLEYEFRDANNVRGAYCNDGTVGGILRPDICKSWWGWNGDDTSNIVKACGEEIANNPAPTPKPTRSLPPTPQQTFVTEYNRNKPDEYNLINPYPECYYGKDQSHYCAEMYSQNDNSQDLTHPNYEERLTATLINMARLFPEYYWFKSKYGAPNDKYDTAGYCGKATQVPLYYNQKANEMTRFHQYDQMIPTNCVQRTDHSTCDNPNRCKLFTNFATTSQPECNAAPRWKAFYSMKPDDNLYIDAEGICGRDGCYVDGHCSAMFDPNREIIGIGKWKGSFSYDIVYGKYLSNTGKTYKKYPIVYGAHLDGRYYWNYNLPKEVQDTASKKITFLLQWYGVANGNIKASSVQLLYEDDEHTMTRLQGTDLSGFYEIEFEMNSDNNKNFCKPYAFIVEANDGKKYRLPENDKYFFGTALFASYNKEPLYECDENHYYKNDNNQWIPNGGPLNLITSNNGCIGCSKADKLELLNIYKYHECPGTDTNCHTTNGHRGCDAGFITSCSKPLLSDCNSVCNKI